MKIVDRGSERYLLVELTVEDHRNSRFWADLHLKYAERGVYLTMINVSTCRVMWVDWVTIHDAIPYNRTEKFLPSLLESLLVVN